MSPPSGASHNLNPFVERWLDDLGRNGPVLDFGCGNGFWTRQMAGKGFRVVGLEPGAHDDHDHGGHFGESGGFGHGHVHEAGDEVGAPVVSGDGTSLPFGDATLGLVWCIHVLHHLDDPVSALAEVRRTLRPGGYLVLAETVEDNPAIRVGRRLYPSWDGVPIKSRFTAARLLGLVADAGLTVVDRRQHSLVSFAAWTLPRSGARAWTALSRLEGLLPAGLTSRWGAHVELVARRPA